MDNKQNIQVARHTPGPWQQEPAMSSDVSHIRYITADGAIIASVRHRSEQTQDEALANARLMAEAPNLLALLEYAVETIESEWPERQWPRLRVLEMRAAMARIKGRKP